MRHIFLNEKALGASYDSLLSKKSPKLKSRGEKKSRDFKISSRIGKISNFNKYSKNGKIDDFWFGTVRAFFKNSKNATLFRTVRFAV